MNNIFLKLIAVAAVQIVGIVAAQAQIPAGSNRPASVPSGFVITPFGYFHSSCVHRLAEKDVLHSDRQLIQHPNGTSTQMPTCAHPHYTTYGEAVSGDKRGPLTPSTIPTISHAWIESASVTTSFLTVGVGGGSGSPSAVWPFFGTLSAEWSVPYTPASHDGQTLFYFPGLEDGPGSVILQPVLGWNADFASAWGIASWHCCPGGITVEATPQQVSPGDSIYGVMGCASGTTTSCTSWNISACDMQNGRCSQMLGTSSLGAIFVWAFAGALEVYNVVQCSDFPSNGLISFHDIQLVNNLGQLIASPNWSANPAPSTLTPQCFYRVTLPTEVILGAGQ
jgi:hypothetical protein